MTANGNNKGMTMERATLEINPPRDRLNIIYFILLLHGIGTLMPWNMFINAISVSFLNQLFGYFLCSSAAKEAQLINVTEKKFPFIFVAVL